MGQDKILVQIFIINNQHIGAEYIEGQTKCNDWVRITYAVLSFSVLI